MSKGSRAPKWQRDLRKWERENPNRHLPPLMRVMADAGMFGIGLYRIGKDFQVNPIIPRHFFRPKKGKDGFKHLIRKERERRAREPKALEIVTHHIIPDRIKWADELDNITDEQVAKIRAAMTEKIDAHFRNMMFGTFE